MIVWLQWRGVKGNRTLGGKITSRRKSYRCRRNGGFGYFRTSRIEAGNR